MSDEADAARAHRASGELNEIGYAFDAVKAALVYELQNTAVGADPKILRLHMALQNLAAVQAALNRVIDAGRVADASMAARNALASERLNSPH